MGDFAYPLGLAFLVGLSAAVYAGDPALGGLVTTALIWVGSLVFAAVAALEAGRDRRGQMIEARRQANREAMQRLGDDLREATDPRRYG